MPGLKEHLREMVRPYYLKWLYFHLDKNNCPAEFKRWREYPSMPLDACGHLLDAQQEHQPDAIFFPMNDWHGIRQRTQQLARGFAALGHRCVYLNPHLGREFPQVYSRIDNARLSLLEPGIVELHVHLPREPVFHHRRLRPEEVARVSKSLLTVLHTADSRRQMSIVSLPVWMEVALQLREELGTPIVYDCHDLLEGFQGIGPELIEQEVSLFEQADLVVFSAERLAQEHIKRKPELAAKSVVIRNAADSQHFETVVRSNPREPVTIGYAGSLNSWFDIEAVTAAAGRHPEWRFLLVGPMAQAFPKDVFRRHGNIETVGEVSYHDLPKWLARFDVATIPFLVQPLTKATNPVKMYEYFACGLPVVSAPLSEVMRYAGLTYIADSPAEFVRQLEKAAAEDDPAKQAERRRVASQENWMSRCQELVVALSTLAPQPPRGTTRP